MYVLFDGVCIELCLFGDGVDVVGIKECIGLWLECIELVYVWDMCSGVGVFVSIGVIVLFVGLFGIVWGIMNSFIGIVDVNIIYLVVVVLGIVEVLLVIVFGLVVVIFVVVIYNYFVWVLVGLCVLVGDVFVGV